MYKRMLLPLDGSELAEVALSYAKGIASRFGLELLLLHVAGKGEAESLPLHQAYIDQTSERLRREMAEIQGKTGGKPVAVKGEVVLGYAADEILRYAAEKEVDLTIMATHGRSGVSRWVMGSVADKVLGSSALPVLLVRAGMPQDVAYERWSDPKLLVPLDGSELAELVLPHVEALALAQDGAAAEVILVRVCEPLVLPPVTTPETTVNWGTTADQYLLESKKSAEKYLTRIQRGLSDAGLKVSLEVLDGDPATGVIDYAGQRQVNLIVMATHGRSGLGRWAYGSVAQKVLHGASCPTLMVRPPLSPSITPKIIAAIRSLPPI
ncbi:MAG: universal stress protein [Dehalococcoidia bacterium]|nr:universal stress protein [Dehalococcoidia bacterium]